MRRRRRRRRRRDAAEAARLHSHKRTHTHEQVPEHLRPGNNAGQMNWAERQLASAQQNQRPLAGG